MRKDHSVPEARPYHRPSRHTRRTPRPGFTLVEVLVSVSILSIIMAGLMSALLLATKTLPRADDPAMIAPEADTAFELIMADAMLASSVSADGDTLKLIIPDQNADKTDEIIAYELAAPGSPPTSLLRTFNGRAPRTLLSRVRAMSFTTSTVEGDLSQLTIEIVTGTGVVHRTSFELLTRPGK